MNLYGFKTDNVTNILSLIALIISVGSISLQLINFYKGADILFAPPRQITIIFEKSTDGKEYLRFAIPMIYLNNGSSGYDDILKNETMTFNIKSELITLVSVGYVDITEIDDRVIKTFKASVQPIQIKAGEVEVHTTYFSSWISSKQNKWKNFITKETFLDHIAGIQELQLNLTSSTYKGKIIKQICIIKTSQFLDQLKSRGVSAPACINQLDQ